MEFVDPSLEKVFKTLINNDRIINFLKENNHLITKKSLYDTYTAEQVKSMELAIYTNNVTTLYDVSQVLVDNSTKIKSTEIWVLLSNKIAWDELAAVLGVTSDDLTADVYKEIMYCYKYCCISSFFQNNRDKFIPENDFEELEDNGAASAFYDAMMKEFDKMDCVISKCNEYLDYDKIPWDLINYLTQLLGFEKATISAAEDNEEKFRELAKNILDIYRIKGTNYSFELFFNFLGFNIEIKEYYFDRRLYYTINGNAETNSSDNSEYEYYLTTCNPSDNNLKDIGIDETVLSSDLTDQYSLIEFKELVKEYGIEAVLGYSPVYPVYASDGETILEYKEYTGKVYKYFKTNLIYYTISMDKKNPTDKQISAFTKYLDFLTPTYIMRKIEVKTYEEKEDEDIGFDDDGNGDTDAYGNYIGGFNILDDEDWESNYSGKYTKANVNGVLQTVDENNYDGKDETYKSYENSVGGTKFRLPLGGRRSIAKSTSKYLTGGTGTRYPKWRRLKYYILYTLNGEETDNIESDECVITPYYTIPPYLGTEHYRNADINETYQTGTVNLLGKDSDGNEINVKTQIRDANLRKPVDYVTDKTIDSFMNSNSDFNALAAYKTCARKLSLIKSIQFSPSKEYTSAYDAFIKNFYGYKISNINILEDTKNALSDTEKESFSTDDNTLNTLTNSYYKKIFNSQVYNDSEVASRTYATNSILKDLNYGDCVVSYDGTLTNGTLKLYRYGGYRYPIEKDADQFTSTYLDYLQSFTYELEEYYDYSPSEISRDVSVNLSTSYVTKNSEASALKYALNKRQTMIDNANSKSYDLNYVLDDVYYISSTGKYFKPVKVPTCIGICTSTYASGKTHIFKTMSDAEAYFTTYPDEKVNNAEFYVSDDSYLYIYKYTKRRGYVYSSLDENLYDVKGNSREEIKKLDNFFGKLNISTYSKSSTGEYIIVDGLAYDAPASTSLQKYSLDSNGDTIIAEINDYDKYWDGYDEEADNQDFIFYNADHKITWEKLGYNKDLISRPIKNDTDNNYEENLSEINKKYNSSTDDLSDFVGTDISGTFKGYYNTIPQKIIDEISFNTIDNFTDDEKINWSTTTYGEASQYVGILSIIEDNMEDLTGSSHNKGFDYYSYSSDFIQDYYRMIVGGNLTYNSIPTNIEEDLGISSDADITNTIKANIIKCYNNAIKEISNVLNDISKKRIYYEYIGNWKETCGLSPDNTKEAKKQTDDNLKIFYSYPMENLNPVDYGFKEVPTISKGGVTYYYTGKTSFINTIITKLGKLNVKFKDEINFSTSSYADISTLIGDDCYSLIEEGEEKEGKITKAGKNDKAYQNTYLYYYKIGASENNLKISYPFYITMDSNYNFYIPYTLSYGLLKYSLDDYNKHNEIYSEFTEMFDLLNSYANSQTDLNKENINSFLKQYYYNKLVSLYRESPIDDNTPIGLSSYGKKPMKAYPKLAERMDGKSGLLSSSSTLLSSYKNEGGKDDTDIRLMFSKINLDVTKTYNVTEDNSIVGNKIYYYLDANGNYLTVSYNVTRSTNEKGTEETKITDATDTSKPLHITPVKNLSDLYDIKGRDLSLDFYVSKEDFINAYGYDFNRYYKMMDLYNSSLSISKKKELSEAIEEMYLKQFACIRPRFKYYDEHPEFYSYTLTAWQKVRILLEKDYSTASADTVDANYKSITDSDGNIIDSDGNVISLESSDEIAARLADAEYIIISVKDSDALSNNENADYVFKDLSSKYNEESNIYGYLSVRKLTQKLIDNYVSFPQSLSWIEEDDNGDASEYISFGDDRTIDVNYTNKFYTKKEYSLTKDTKVIDGKTYYKLVDSSYVEADTSSIDNPSDSSLYELSDAPNTDLYYDYAKKIQDSFKHISYHDEENIKFSANGYPIDINGNEIKNYSKSKTLEDQGYSPKYISMMSYELSSDESVNSEKAYYTLSGETYSIVDAYNNKSKSPKDEGWYEASSSNDKKIKNSDEESEYEVTIDNDGSLYNKKLVESNIYYDNSGNLILEVDNDKIHTGNISFLKVLYQLTYITLLKIRMNANAYFYGNKVNTVYSTYQKIVSSVSNIKKAFPNTLANISEKNIKSLSKIKKTSLSVLANIFEKGLLVKANIKKAFPNTLANISEKNIKSLSEIKKTSLSVLANIFEKGLLANTKIKKNILAMSFSINYNFFRSIYQIESYKVLTMINTSCDRDFKIIAKGMTKILTNISLEENIITKIIFGYNNDCDNGYYDGAFINASSIIGSQELKLAETVGKTSVDIVTSIGSQELKLAVVKDIVGSTAD